MEKYWNYRILKKDWGNGLVSYEVCEVYYDNDIPESWIWGKNVLSGDSKEHLEDKIHSLLKGAFKKPILEIVGDDEDLIEVKK